jgi:hypothetical protein
MVCDNDHNLLTTGIVITSSSSEESKSESESGSDFSNVGHSAIHHLLPPYTTMAHAHRSVHLLKNPNRVLNDLSIFPMLVTPPYTTFYHHTPPSTTIHHHVP